MVQRSKMFELLACASRPCRNDSVLRLSCSLAPEYADTSHVACILLWCSGAPSFSCSMCTRKPSLHSHSVFYRCAHGGDRDQRDRLCSLIALHLILREPKMNMK